MTCYRLENLTGEPQLFLWRERLVEAFNILGQISHLQCCI